MYRCLFCTQLLRSMIDTLPCKTITQERLKQSSTETTNVLSCLSNCFLEGSSEIPKTAVPQDQVETQAMDEDTAAAVAKAMQEQKSEKSKSLEPTLGGSQVHPVSFCSFLFKGNKQETFKHFFKPWMNYDEFIYIDKGCHFQHELSQGGEQLLILFCCHIICLKTLCFSLTPFRCSHVEIN